MTQQLASSQSVTLVSLKNGILPRQLKLFYVHILELMCSLLLLPWWNSMEDLNVRILMSSILQLPTVFILTAPVLLTRWKLVGKSSTYKTSRSVVQAYNDPQQALWTHVLAVQQVSPRMFLAICAMDKDLTLFTRGISKAYVNSETPIQQPIFVQTPSALRLTGNILLQIEWPLYEIPQAGL